MTLFGDILSVLTTLLAFGFTISLLVFIHEGGHFLVAKWARVWVHEFAIGFGPAIWRKKKGETQYTFRILPLGGFVRMAGEEAKTEEDEEVPQDRLFSAKVPLARMAIIFAGPVANILFAILMMIFYINVFGVPFVEVGGVSETSPAVGVLQSGDKLVKLGGEDVYFREQVQSIVQRVGESPITAVIERSGEELVVEFQPYYDAAVGRYLIGIFFDYPLNRISEVPGDSALAQQDVLKANDIILAVNGVPTPSWPEVVEELNLAIDRGELIRLKIQRQDELLSEVELDPSLISKEEIRRISNFVLGITSTLPTLERVAPNTYLYQQGLRTGDRLLAANGEKVGSLTDAMRAILTAQALDEPLSLEVERDGSVQALNIEVVGKDFVEILQGAQFMTAQRRPAGVFASVSIGFKRITDTVGLLYTGIMSVIRGQTSAGEAFRGPVGIANLLGVSLTQGFDRFFQLVALLSLVLGIFNLVPFPALDGSRILFIFVELVRGRPISPEKEGWVHYIGFILLMGLIVIITWQDIQRIFRGEL